MKSINTPFWLMIVIFFVITSCNKSDNPIDDNIDDNTEIIVTSNFVADNIEGDTPLTVKFTNNSQNAVSYLWDFGDGTTSTEFSPEHIFTNQSTTEKKVFEVKLTSKGIKETATSTTSITVNESPLIHPIVFYPGLNYGSVTDIDGNTYKTIDIYGLTWMAENLRVTKFNDGTSLNLLIDNVEWTNTNLPAYCWYDNNSDYEKVYGALYNGATVLDFYNSNKNICPEDWHVATNDNWRTLYNNIELGRIVETGTFHWIETQTWKTNNTGFTALPAGQRTHNGDFSYIREMTRWAGDLHTVGFYYSDHSLQFSNLGININASVSIRCVKD